MKKHLFKFLAVFLSVLIAVMSFPLSAFATSINGTNGQKETQTSSNIRKDTYEIIELRDEYVKQFKQQDGTIFAIQYSDPVHYLDANGKWADIDNTLSPSGNEFSIPNAKVKFAKKITGNESVFTLHSGNRKIEIGLINSVKKTAGKVQSVDSYSNVNATELQKMMTLDKLSSKIIYENILENVDLEYILVSNNIKENIIVKSAKSEYVFNFTLSLNNLSAEKSTDGSILISDTSSGEPVYVIPAGFMFDSAGEKSDLVEYELTSSGNGKYLLTITADKEWANDEKRVFPLTIDPSIGVPSSTVTDLDISSSSVDRSSPTDPSMFVSNIWHGYWKTSTLPTLPDSAYITSAYISMYSTSTGGNYVGVYRIITDWDSDLTWSKTTASTSPQGVISDAVLDYNYIDGTATDNRYRFDITQLVKSWYDGTYSNYGIGFKIVDGTTSTTHTSFVTNDSPTIASRPQFVVVYKDMKGIEEYWSYSSQNLGLAGTSHVNNATGALALSKPLLSTTDSLMPYIPTIVYNSSLANRYNVYPNAQSSYSSAFMPYGFKLNISETIIKKAYTNASGTSVDYYIWSDSDGTEHSFLPVEGTSNVYEDEDGLQLKLTVSSTTCTIKDDSKTVKTFAKMSSVPGTDVYGAWYLSSIADKNGNKISFTFDNSYKPIGVSLVPNGSSAISYLTISYNSDNMPYLIWNSTSKDAIVFRYSSTATGSISTTSTKYLREVVYAHGNSSVTATNWLNFYNNSSNTTNITVDGKASYTYDSNGYITRCKDELSEYEVIYTYSSGKVTYIQEYGKNSIAGQKIGLNYFSGYTEVRNSGSDDIFGNTDDIITRKVFDSEGRVVNAYSTDAGRTTIYGATSGEYETADKVKNNIKSATTIGGSTSNYIMNGGFELQDASGNAKYWIKSSSNIGYYFTFATYGGQKGASFDIKNGVTDTLTQYTKLRTGKYTLSMSVNAFSCENVTAYIKVQSLNNTSNVFIEEIPVNKYYAAGTDSIFSMTFDASNYNSTGYESFKIQIIVSGGDIDDSQEASIDIDNVMLEENIGNSHYSVVEMGNFEMFTINSSGTYVENGNSHWQNESGGFSRYSESAPFGYTGYVSGSINSEKYLKQRVYIAPNSVLAEYDYGGPVSQQPSEYLISGFAKGNGQISGSHGIFALRVDIYYYQGEGKADIVEKKYYPFQTDCYNWQFVSGEVEADASKCIHYIDIVCEYSFQPSGYALFDEIALVESVDDSVVKYKYYTAEHGNLDGLLWVKDSGYYTEVYEYTDNRQIKRIANSHGELCDYVYASNGVDISSETYYTISPSYYPYLADDPDSIITKTPKTKTEYLYNSYGQLISTDTYEITFSGSVVVAKTGTKHIVSTNQYETTAGSKIFGAILQETDSLSRRTRHYYDTTNGLLLATININDAGTSTGTCFTYDAIGNITNVKPCNYISSTSYSAITGSENVTYQYNAHNLLSSITTASTTYTFTYDEYGNTDTISAGTYYLADYSYNSYNGKLNKITYGNGLVVRYVYDELDNVKEIWHKNGSSAEVKAYAYSYTAFGQLARFDNLLLGKSTLYKYDTSERLVGQIEFDTSSEVIELGQLFFYRDNGRLQNAFYSADYASSEGTVQDWSHNYSYTYYDDGRIRYNNITTDITSGKIDYTYDTYNRLTTKVYNFYLSKNTSSKYTNTVSYTFVNNANNTSALVESFTSKVNSNTATTDTFTYDRNGNITKIVSSSGTETRYVYDKLGQLLREDNPDMNRTYVYSYDNAGNITSKKTYALTAEGITPTTLYSNIAYGYNDASWGDLLTSYSGNTIEYDNIGNPLTWGDYGELTWRGRQLISYTNTDTEDEITFTYNDDGIRTSKTVNGVKHTYILSGSKIISESWGIHFCIYLYDESGSPIGMQYRTSSMAKDVFYTFWFEKNLQGDIVAVYNDSGVKLITYKYDAWGNFTRTINNISGTNRSALYNPFAYRGYYYDSETSLYYLNSRYYDSNVGRFINADGYVNANGDIIGFNMFAYCGNNPVNRMDHSGRFWISALIVTAIVVCTVALSGCSSKPAPTSNYGAAQPFVNMPGSSDRNSPNCYAYAIGSSVNEQPGGKSGRTPKRWNDVNDVGKSVEADLKAMGKTVRKIDGPDAKVYDNEFKIALRVGTQPYYYNLYTREVLYDYHFMRQTSTGQWAEKHGIGGSAILWDPGMTPDTIPWTLNGVPYYDSKIIYYAVGN